VSPPGAWAEDSANAGLEYRASLDVPLTLAGAAIGAAVGWAVPRLLDGRPVVFGVVLGAGSSPGSSGVLLTGGLFGGGPCLFATWGF
jgi:hypothetical protein